MRIRDKLNLRSVEYIVVTSIVIILAVFFATRSRGDADYCRKIFYGLIAGRQSVQSLIDWENLKVLGLDIGATYNKLPDEKEKANYRAAFIKSFPEGFKRGRGNKEVFTNWKVYGINKDELSICAYDKKQKKTVLFGLAKRGGQKKLISISVKGLPDQPKP